MAMKMNVNTSNALAFQMANGQYGSVEVGMMAAAAGEAGGVNFNDLQKMMDSLKGRTDVLSAEIVQLTKDVQKKKSTLNNLSERHERVKSRYAQRCAQVKEYEKTLKALTQGYMTLQDATRTMMETMTQSDQAASAQSASAKQDEA